MKLFECQGCGQVVYFENTHCERCARALGFLPAMATVSALEPEGDAWRTLARPERQVRYCANATHDACNWLLEAGDEGELCTACRFNRAIPDLSVGENLLLWRRVEIAKHRLFYTLLRLGLPLQGRDEDHPGGLAFDVLAGSSEPDGPTVMTGHDTGLITIALEEADDAERERRRAALHEPYRSLLGHFRHEIGHYYWDVLVRDGGWVDACREVFGDDTQDYQAALDRHYREGPPAGWQENFVSAYATTHPWEDWAETWAHYFHIVDTLEMARAFGIRIRPWVGEEEAMASNIRLDPYRVADVQEIVDAWLPLSFAMNSLNRAMGNPDVYPFVISAPVVAKLGFVHAVVHGTW